MSHSARIDLLRTTRDGSPSSAPDRRRTVALDDIVFPRAMLRCDLHPPRLRP